MSTTWFFRTETATGAVPNAKQSSDSITHDVASSYATYASPADMAAASGSTNGENSASVGGIETTHYTHYGTWVSPTLGPQTVEGTVTVALVMTEGNNKSANFPRVKIYRWTADDTFGSDLLSLTTDDTEIGTSFPTSPVVYYSTVSLTAATFYAGDRIVIEVESQDTATATTAYTHGIRFGNSTSGYNSYVTFSQTLTYGFRGNLTKSLQFCIYASGRQVKTGSATYTPYWTDNSNITFAEGTHAVDYIVVGGGAGGGRSSSLYPTYQFTYGYPGGSGGEVLVGTAEIQDGDGKHSVTIGAGGVTAVGAGTAGGDTTFVWQAESNKLIAHGGTCPGDNGGEGAAEGGTSESGGDGTPVNLYGTPGWIGGGGGGGDPNNGSPGAGGAGGGGDGDTYDYTQGPAESGSDYYGGGGGGGHFCGLGGSGGKGAVYLRPITDVLLKYSISGGGSIVTRHKYNSLAYTIDYYLPARATITFANPTCPANYLHRVPVTRPGGMRADFNDVRFKQTNEATICPYYLEYVQDNAAVFWVKVPSANQSSIYMYWGNDNADSHSDSSIFLFHDHFDGTTLDSTKWTGSATLQNSLVIDTPGMSCKTINQNYIPHFTVIGEDSTSKGYWNVTLSSWPELQVGTTQSTVNNISIHDNSHEVYYQVSLYTPGKYYGVEFWANAAGTYAYARKDGGSWVTIDTHSAFTQLYIYKQTTGPSPNIDTIFLRPFQGTTEPSVSSIAVDKAIVTRSLTYSIRETSGYTFDLDLTYSVQPCKTYSLRYCIVNFGRTVPYKLLWYEIVGNQMVLHNYLSYEVSWTPHVLMDKYLTYDILPIHGHWIMKDLTYSVYNMSGKLISIGLQYVAQPPQSTTFIKHLACSVITSGATRKNLPTKDLEYKIRPHVSLGLTYAVGFQSINVSVVSKAPIPGAYWVTLAATVNVPWYTTYTPPTWYWKFGDGAEQVGSAATTSIMYHEYTQAGTYSATAYIWNGLQPVSAATTFSIPTPETIIIDFFGTPSSGPAPLTVQFSNCSAVIGGNGGGLSYEWNFFDGFESHETNPVHTFASSGEYHVRLIAWGTYTSSALTKQNYIAVTGGSLPTTTINADFDVIRGGTIVGSAGDKIYLVTLTVTDELGNSDSVSKYVQIENIEFVKFRDKSTGHIIDWLWDYGDPIEEG